MSESFLFYFWQVFFPVFLIGAICFVLGYLAGCLLWKGMKNKALSVERANEQLRAELETKKSQLSEH